MYFMNDTTKTAALYMSMNEETRSYVWRVADAAGEGTFGAVVALFVTRQGSGSVAGRMTFAELVKAVRS